MPHAQRGSRCGWACGRSSEIPGSRRRKINRGGRSEYRVRRAGGRLLQVAGTRVSLDSIVYAFLSGQSAESIAQSFPVLSLELVYGAITFYLANRETIDRYLEAQEQEHDAQRMVARAAGPMFYQKLADAERGTPAIR